MRILAVIVGTLTTLGFAYATSGLASDPIAYGCLLFIGLPFAIGLLVTCIAAQGGNMTFGIGFVCGVLALLGSSLGMLAFAMEGVICLLMAMPLALPTLWLGTKLAMTVIEDKAPLAVIFVPIGGAALFDHFRPAETVSEVWTSVEINAAPDRVWNEVVTLDRLPEPTDPFLRTGVACPVRTVIKEPGVGGERHCTLTTGAMPERITVWQPSRRLTFVALQTPPMLREVNPFRETHPAHLKGYYRVLQGEFVLDALPNGRTRLWRSTKYAHRFGPAFYWTPWCNFGAERAHLYVLNAVKDKAESSRVAVAH